MIKYDDLSDLQKRGFDLASNHKLGEFFFKGYAGTGKTTLLSCLAKELGAMCCVLSPTNKAAQVLRDKGIDKAKTIHSTLYQPAEIEILNKDKDGNIIYLKNPDGSFVFDEHGEKVPEVKETKMDFQLAKSEDNDLPPIALVDEASMVTDQIREDLNMCFEAVIYFGDGFQLPPVKSKDVFAVEEANFFLDEVHRVALENPIIRYATSIRSGQEIPLETILCDEIKTCKPNHPKLYQCLVDKNVQAISWTNKTRRMINRKIREQKGYRPDWLEEGENIIAVENVRRKDAQGRSIVKFYNGELLKVAKAAPANNDHFTAEMVHMVGDRMQMMWPFWNEGFFELYDNFREWNSEMNRRKYSQDNKPTYGKSFDFAYCLTAHKSQGSEFDNVAVWDQRRYMRNSKEQDKQRWFYTAITRAKERLLIVK